MKLACTGTMSFSGWSLKIVAFSRPSLLAEELPDEPEDQYLEDEDECEEVTQDGQEQEEKITNLEEIRKEEETGGDQMFRRDKFCT